MVTIPRFLPLLSRKKSNPIEAIAIAAVSKATTAYDFPRLCGCSLLSVFLCSWKIYTPDVVTVENYPRLTISFAITRRRNATLLGETFRRRHLLRPKVDSAAVPISVGKRTLYPIRTRRNLRPRKPVDVKIQDISSDEDGEPAVFLAQMGLRAAETGQLQLRDRVEKYPPKVAAATLDRLPSGTLHTDEEPTGPCADATHLPKFDRSAAERPSTALICTGILYVFSPVVCVTTEVPSIFRYGAEGGSPVAWEKTNPHYRSVRSVRSCHPPRGPKFDSKAKVTSTGSEDFCNTVINRIFLQEARRSERRSGIVGGSSYGGFLVGVHLESKINRLRLQETIVPDASTGEVSGVQRPGSGSPTDVDYSQQEENRHERDLDPLGRGRKKT
ncbi:hypothetical protein Bca52824_017599 [Brassica carinata]|uniref:Uncharacterized protein n=1 Tax=Brassica carinata TaxID=52824 RepID=A0A8X7VNP2_BRACI|nr:hypothetical protein Bca52824_017599 [Brassica carinata]